MAVRVTEAWALKVIFRRRAAPPASTGLAWLGDVWRRAAMAVEAHDWRRTGSPDV